MTPPPEKVSSITRKPFQRNTSFLKPTKEAIRNLFSQLPLTPPKRIVIPVFADESNQIPGSVIIESEKRKLSSQTPALLVPHKRGDNPFYSVLILKKNFVNNQKTFPKEYVIPEADEGGNQESPTSVTVHSSKANCHPSFGGWKKPNTGICNHRKRKTKTFKSDPGIARSSQSGVTIPF